ncbi:MAG TPA: antibiotic biosynthesis monooxygenase [Bacteroidota bacterium]|nr:antibiotic biosynthesis monooxygenase [Bacteroidota bacterium]
MITRVWHGKTKKEHAEEYMQYVIRTGVVGYRRTPGNMGVQIWQKDEGEFTHIYTVTLWKDLEAIKGFAGADIEKARYYPEDKKYLVEFEQNVTHYRARAFVDPGVNQLWRITM